MAAGIADGKRFAPERRVGKRDPGDRHQRRLEAEKGFAGGALQHTACESTDASCPATTDLQPRMSSRVSTMAYVGPAFLVSVGYIDPGNWATSLEAGSRFGYRLLWVILISNLIALVIQNLAARLGLVTGRSYAANCRRHFPAAVWVAVWLAAEAALVATDIAEFLGAMLGFKLLLGIDLIVAAALSVIATFGLLALSRFGDRIVERAIIGFVALVGCCYAFELGSISPDWIAAGKDTVTPWLNGSSALVAAAVLGATVMPHNLFLHSAVVRRQFGPRETASALRATFVDSFIALNAAWLINTAIAITAAAVFFTRGIRIDSITDAYATLEPLLGHLAAAVFGLGLLAAGVSSSAAATFTGQVIMEGFIGLRMNLLLRRGLTLGPALAIIFLGAPSALLIASQVALSLLLPLALIPLILLTAQSSVMGQYANGRVNNALACASAVIILALNAMLLFSPLH